MENKETIVTLKGLSEREGKTGRKYFMVETSEGNMSCFENSITEEIRKRIGKKVRVEIAEKGDFKNIRKFLGEVEVEKISNKEETKEEIVEARKLKDQSIYTSYVKDLLVVGWELDKAIEAIKKVKQSLAE